MAYKTIRYVGFFATILSAASVLGALALTFGPWAQPSPTIERLLLMVGFVVFSMIGTVATNVVGVLESQADEIAALRQRLGAGSEA